MKSALFVVLPVLLTGCVSLNYVKPHPPDPNDATVYLIRRNAAPQAWNLNVFLDQHKVAAVANWSHVVFQFPAGHHDLHAEFPFLAGVGGEIDDQALDLEAGATYYLVITGTVGRAPDPDCGDPGEADTLNIDPVSAQDGEALLHKVR